MNDNSRKVSNIHIQYMNSFIWMLVTITFASCRCPRHAAPLLNAYVPGTVWEYAVGYSSDSRTDRKGKQTWYFNGKFTQDDKTYLKLYRQYTSQEFLEELKSNLKWGGCLPEINTETIYYGGIRTQDDKVYYKNPYLEEELLIFDFAAQVGDTISVQHIVRSFYYPDPRTVQIRVTELVPTKFQGVFLMKINTPPFDSTYPDEWLTGIGSIDSPVTNFYSNTLGGYWSDLTKVTMCGKTVYERKR